MISGMYPYTHFPTSVAEKSIIRTLNPNLLNFIPKIMLATDIPTMQICIIDQLPSLLGPLRLF